MIRVPTFCAQCQAPFAPPVGLYGTNDVPCPSCYQFELTEPKKPCYTALPPAAVVLVIKEAHLKTRPWHENLVLTVTNRHYKGVALPGGKIETQDAGPGRDDPIKFGCVREVREEVDLVIAPHNLRLLYKGPGSLETGRLVFLYHAKRAHQTPRAVEESTTIEWMSWERLCEIGVFAPYYRTAFPDGVDMLKPTEWIT